MPKTSKKQLINVSTKTGDKGESGLADGRRVAKYSLVFTALGDIDELNSWIGLVVAGMEDVRFKQERAVLRQVQEQLFYVGAEVAASPTTKLAAEALGMIESESEKLQGSMGEDWTTKFLMPGGSMLGGYCDLARAVCRRAERSVAAYGAEGTISPLVRQYMNRLSDYLYVLRCFVNQELAVKEKQFIKK
ncbi:MAG: cob(I)alamin adenosyltransferase [Patescibacteria group bacterium]|jgi:cob(I)alamin adenosyltransferase|nr:cob(I)alamin adenosyltransferase [Patescibacteria group bacterium]